MSGINSSTSHAAVQTELDDIFVQSFNPKSFPGYIDATSSLAFKQDTSTKSNEIMEVFMGSGVWGKKKEQENVGGDHSRIDNKITFNHATFADKIEIPKEFFDDEMHGLYESMVQEFGEMGAVTRDINAFEIYRGAFDTTLTADGLPWVSDSHVTISGDTVDNKLTAVLTNTSLAQAITNLIEQKNQRGIVKGGTPRTLLVPPALFEKAVTITESTKKAFTADNDLNYFSDKFGITIATSNRLGAVSGGSDTAWFLLGANMSAKRWVREGMTTRLMPWDQQTNDAYIYKGRYREVVGAVDYSGMIGSTGEV